MTRQRLLSGFMALMLLLGGTMLLSAQQRFMLNQEEAQQFRLAKQLFHKGQQLLSKEKMKKAEKAFKDCLEHFPKYSHADYALAQIYYDGKNYPLAIQHVENAKKSYPYVSQLGANSQLEYLSKLRQQKDQLRESIRQMKERLQQVKEQSRSSSSGSSSGSSENASATQAASELEHNIRHAEQTVTRINDRLREPIAKGTGIPGGYYYVHGNIYFKLKKYRDAMNEYLAAVKAEPTHGMAYNNIANLYFMARQYNKALYYVQKAEKHGAKVHPDFKKAILKSLKGSK